MFYEIAKQSFKRNNLEILTFKLINHFSSRTTHFFLTKHFRRKYEPIVLLVPSAGRSSIPMAILHGRLSEPPQLQKQQQQHQHLR